MKKAGLFKPAFLFLNTEKLFLEFVLYGQVCPCNVMVRSNARRAIFHSNLVIYARRKDEVAAEVEVGRDTKNEISPVTAGIVTIWSGVNAVVPDQLGVEIEDLIRYFCGQPGKRQGIIEHKDVGPAGGRAAVRVSVSNYRIVIRGPHLDDAVSGDQPFYASDVRPGKQGVEFLKVDRRFGVGCAQFRIVVIDVANFVIGF